MTLKKEKKGGNLLQAPKGTRDIWDDEFYLFEGFFEKAAEVAIYYGFKPITTPIIEHQDIFERGVGAGTDIVEKEMYTLKTRGGDKLVLRPEGTAGLMRAYAEHGWQAEPQPVMFFYYGPFFRHENPQRGRYRQFYQFGLEILGSKKSISDALIIKLSTVILEESGLKDIRVELNSIGDADCRSNYRRELINYYKKHIKDICPDCRERLKTNPLRVLDCKNEKCQEIKAEAPESIAFLCQSCKTHLKEVLEYLDAMNIPYQINSNLVRGLDYYSRTVFEIFTGQLSDDTNQPLPIALAAGGRYDYLAKTLGLKKEVSAVGMSFGVDRVVSLLPKDSLTPRFVKKPKVAFIQLSTDAKQKSIEVIEALRKAKIPITHALPKDSLSAQLGAAERLGVPFAVILGQKEALESSVIVRDMDTRSQDTVKIKDLADYLKKRFAQK